MENKNMEGLNETGVKTGMSGMAKLGAGLAIGGLLAFAGKKLYNKFKANKVEVEPEVEAVDNNE